MNRFLIYGAMLLTLVLACEGCLEVKPREFEIEFTGTLTDTTGRPLPPQTVYFYRQVLGGGFHTGRNFEKFDSVGTNYNGQFSKKLFVTTTECDSYFLGLINYYSQDRREGGCSFVQNKFVFVKRFIKYR